eukprot:8727571-Alexandrium_andersonii.AAC.1
MRGSHLTASPPSFPLSVVAGTAGAGLDGGSRYQVPPPSARLPFPLPRQLHGAALGRPSCP